MLIPQFVPQHLNCTLFGFRRMLREEYRLWRNNYRTVTPCSGDLQVVFFFLNGIDPTRKGAHPAFFRKSQTRVFCKLTRHWKQSVFLLYIEVSSRVPHQRDTEASPSTGAAMDLMYLIKVIRRSC